MNACRLLKYTDLTLGDETEEVFAENWRKMVDLDQMTFQCMPKHYMVFNGKEISIAQLHGYTFRPQLFL